MPAFPAILTCNYHPPTLPHSPGSLLPNVPGGVLQTFNLPTATRGNASLLTIDAAAASRDADYSTLIYGTDQVLTFEWSCLLDGEPCPMAEGFSGRRGQQLDLMATFAQSASARAGRLQIPTSALEVGEYVFKVRLTKRQYSGCALLAERRQSLNQSSDWASTAFDYAAYLNRAEDFSKVYRVQIGRAPDLSMTSGVMYANANEPITINSLANSSANYSNIAWSYACEEPANCPKLQQISRTQVSYFNSSLVRAQSLGLALVLQPGALTPGKVYTFVLSATSDAGHATASVVVAVNHPPPEATIGASGLVGDTSTLFEITAHAGFRAFSSIYPYESSLPTRFRFAYRNESTLMEHLVSDFQPLFYPHTVERCFLPPGKLLLVLYVRDHFQAQIRCTRQHTSSFTADWHLVTAQVAAAAVPAYDSRIHSTSNWLQLLRTQALLQRTSQEHSALVADLQRFGDRPWSPDVYVSPSMHVMHQADVLQHITHDARLVTTQARRSSRSIMQRLATQCETRESGFRLETSRYLMQVVSNLVESGFVGADVGVSGGVDLGDELAFWRNAASSLVGTLSAGEPPSSRAATAIFSVTEHVLRFAGQVHFQLRCRFVVAFLKRNLLCAGFAALRSPQHIRRAKTAEPGAAFASELHPT